MSPDTLTPLQSSPEQFQLPTEPTAEQRVNPAAEWGQTEVDAAFDQIATEELARDASALALPSHGFDVSSQPVVRPSLEVQSYADEQAAAIEVANNSQHWPHLRDITVEQVNA
jgi:hypothetical protein